MKKEIYTYREGDNKYARRQKLVKYRMKYYKKSNIKNGTDVPKDQYSYYTVDEETTLLDWLLAHLGESRSKVKAILQGRGIKVNGKCVTRHDFVLLPGTEIAVSKTKRHEVLKNRYVKLVYEDKYIVVVEKNVGILSMAVGKSSPNVKAVLDDYFRRTKQNCQAHVVHRLDKDTSGLMIYAKDKRTELKLEAEWHKTVYDRRYVAVLSGTMEDNEGTVANWLKDNKAYVTFSSPTDNGGKYAVTHFYTLDRTPYHSLVEFKLETGRKNQIRVHAVDLCHPVCGDRKYGNGDDPIGRLCLHAFVLCFYHPMTHEPMEFETKIPQTFTQLFK